MKAKITLTICIGCTALILTAVMFTQFKTVDQTDITAIETMREAELRTELASWKTKYEDIETKIEERDSKINEYKQELNSSIHLRDFICRIYMLLGGQQCLFSLLQCKRKISP